jgi:hypothetical protein
MALNCLSIRFLGPAMLISTLLAANLFAGCSAANNDSSEDQATATARPTAS